MTTPRKKTVRDTPKPRVIKKNPTRVIKRKAAKRSK